MPRSKAAKVRFNWFNVGWQPFRSTSESAKNSTKTISIAFKMRIPKSGGARSPLIRIEFQFEFRYLWTSNSFQIWFSSFQNFCFQIWFSSFQNFFSWSCIPFSYSFNLNALISLIIRLSSLKCANFQMLWHICKKQYSTCMMYLRRPH